MMTPPSQQQMLQKWFESLQNEIIQKLEKVEQLFNPTNKFCFERQEWKRSEAENNLEPGGGGTMAIMRGDVFEKVGVNISTVKGRLPQDFSKSIPGTQYDSSFWASGISFVAHPKNPYVPIAHMNTRHIITSQSWFGGGADLTPVIPFDEDTDGFHAQMRKACDLHHPDDYQQFKLWCDNYFYITHRHEPRGVGGIFFDNLNTGDFDHDFEFIKAVGCYFIDIYIDIVNRHMHKTWGDEEIQQQLKKRARYVEFNLIYDRGTLFGLKTGGNIEAIFMSLPPQASWR